MTPLAPTPARQRINELWQQARPFVFLINYDQTEVIVEEVCNLPSDELLIDFPLFSNVGQAAPSTTPLQWYAEKHDRVHYEHQINEVKRQINAGNSYLANLTERIAIHTNLSLRDIFLRAHAPYRCWLRHRFTCFSPEPFVRVDGTTISTFPMKGTIDANLPDAAQQLIGSAKEAAEHATIVDLLRNDLSMVAHDVTVDRYRYIEEVNSYRGTLLQTSSCITGQLHPPYTTHIGDALFTMLPAGSVTGAPKAKTVAFLEDIEDYSRGFYTGIMGYGDGQKLDSAVMIRFIENDEGKLYYKAGGGITAQSDNDSEYQEIIDKVYVPIY